MIIVSNVLNKKLSILDIWENTDNYNVEKKKFWLLLTNKKSKKMYINKIDEDMINMTEVKNIPNETHKVDLNWKIFNKKMLWLI
jgi:hypothetical protein